MKEIYATTRIRRRDMAEGRYMGSSLRDSVMRDLARGLAEELLRVMELREDMDPETGDLIVRAGVYVAEGGERVRSRNDGSTATFEVPRFAPSFMTEMTLEPPPESPNAKKNRERYNRLMNERIERERGAMADMIEPPKIRPDMNFEGYINMLPGGMATVTQEPMPGAKSPPAALTMETLNQVIEKMKAQEIAPVIGGLNFGDVFTTGPLENPMQFMGERMLRKKAMLEGDAAAVAKYRGEKEVRENTKKRGSTVTIEVGVRKITMPEKKGETG